MKKFLLLFFIFLIPILLLTMIDNYFSKKSDLYIEKEVTTIISDILAESIEKNNVLNDTDNILNYKYNTDGKISSIYIDSTKTSKIISSMNLTLSKLLRDGTIEESVKDINMPLGMLVSRALFTTLGPDIKIEVLPVSSYQTDIYTNLVDYGINNSLFELYLKVNIKVETIIPLKTSQIDYNTNLLLSSIVIQGEVPYYYYMGEGAIQSLPL
ncbi:MAG TPA: sporulation protein YunB [Acholeplasmatales bacterium]|jgi:sporulation protein yunB|nr:sporulation protein YunB [Acholeplasmatales bacterium]